LDWKEIRKLFGRQDEQIVCFIVCDDTPKQIGLAVEDNVEILKHSS